MSFFVELKRRNVMRVGTGYLVTSWLLVQVAATVFPLFGLDETPSRIVIVVLAIGFVPTLIFSWVFELTHEGVKRDHEVNHSQSIIAETGKRLDKMIIVVLGLALGFFALDRFVLLPQKQVVEQLKVTLLGAGPHTQTTDPRAYALYLRARCGLQHRLRAGLPG